jgi:hypothetical protein
MKLLTARPRVHDIAIAVIDRSRRGVGGVATVSRYSTVMP